MAAAVRAPKYALKLEQILLKVIICSRVFCEMPCGRRRRPQALQVPQQSTDTAPAMAAGAHLELLVGAGGRQQGLPECKQLRLGAGPSLQQAAEQKALRVAAVRPQRVRLRVRRRLLGLRRRAPLCTSAPTRRPRRDRRGGACELSGSAPEAASETRSSTDGCGSCWDCDKVSGRFDRRQKPPPAPRTSDHLSCAPSHLTPLSYHLNVPGTVLYGLRR